MYPNPATDYLTIELGSDMEPIGFQLMNSTGQTVLHLAADQLKTQNRIDISAVSKNIYVYRLMHSDGEITGKLVIK